MGGGIVASLLAEAVRVRRAYRTALLMVRMEVVKNVVWIKQAQSPEAAPFKDQMFEAGWFIDDAWIAHAAALAYRMEAKNLRLWANLAAEYTSLRAISAAGLEPPSRSIDSLEVLRDRLRVFDPPLRLRLLRLLVPRRSTRWLGKLAARFLWDDTQIDEATYLRGVRAAEQALQERKMGTS